MNKAPLFYPETSPIHHRMIMKFFFVGLWDFQIKFRRKQVEISATRRGEMRGRTWRDERAPKKLVYEGCLGLREKLWLVTWNSQTGNIRITICLMII